MFEVREGGHRSGLVVDKILNIGRVREGLMYGAE